MTRNERNRQKPWRIGSFTKNFRWGEHPNSLKQLHVAINVGFAGELKPVQRSLFRERISDHNLIDYIPANFFVFNQVIGDESFIAVDELVYQSLTRPHNRQFDRLATFTLLLSEVGQWKGAGEGQDQPSDWARYFVTDQLSNLTAWKASDYSADKIETYLADMKNFEGNTRKLATNLSYFFNSGDLQGFPDERSTEWLTNSIFLALDRYYLIDRPEKASIGWCIDTLQKHEIVDLVGPETDFKIFSIEASARLFSSVNGLDRLAESNTNSDSQIIAVLNRDPALYKFLPAICARWLSKRLFVEIALDEAEFKSIIGADYESEFRSALSRIHNTMPRPTLTGDEIIALFRGGDDNN